MTLPQKIKLIDDLIRENPENRICDYLRLVEDIELIELGVPELPGYPPGPKGNCWPVARVYLGDGPSLAKTESFRWAEKDMRFEIQLLKDKKRCLENEIETLQPPTSTPS